MRRGFLGCVCACVWSGNGVVVYLPNALVPWVCLCKALKKGVLPPHLQHPHPVVIKVLLPSVCCLFVVVVVVVVGVCCCSLTPTLSRTFTFLVFAFSDDSTLNVRTKEKKYLTFFFSRFNPFNSELGA